MCLWQVDYAAIRDLMVDYYKRFVAGDSSALEFQGVVEGKE